MVALPPILVAIVDYGLGNLRSVKLACAYAGLDATITASKHDILNADAVILPGVGAFGDAMSTLHNLDLVGVLRDVAASSKPLIGICLGLQLLMTESFEFGCNRGLGIIEGSVVAMDLSQENGRALKVPQIGWNHIGKPQTGAHWEDTLLHGIADGEYMYFVHSFVVQPLDRSLVLSTSRYGHNEFCSCVHYGNVFACQFHPERSGVEGLKIYKNLGTWLRRAQGVHL